MGRKRCLDPRQDIYESLRPHKRPRISHGVQQLSSQLAEFPVPRQLDLGPFWATSGNLEQPWQQAMEKDYSLGSWHQGTSFSLRSHRRSCADTDDEETQDTATSSGSLGGCCGAQQCRLLPQHSQAAVAGEEDSITSHQPPAPASAAFSFGDRPYVTPNLAAIQGWGP